MKKLLIGLLSLGSMSVMAQDYYSSLLKLSQSMPIPTSLSDKICLVQVSRTDNSTNELYLGSNISKLECENRATTMQKLLLDYTEAHALLFTYQEENKPIQYAMIKRNNNLKAKLFLTNDYEAGYTEGYLEGYGFSATDINR